MVRRTVLLATLALVVGVSGIWWFFDLPGVPQSLRRKGTPAPSVNVVIIAIDTLRADFLSLGGRGWVQNPHIAALAADGTWFARCQSTAPWTGPSFASLYTGLLPYHHGFFNRQFYSLGLEQHTMAEMLAEHSYRTSTWVTIGFLTHAYGMHQGFQAGDKFEDHADGQAAHLVTDAAARYTSTSGENPFFMFLHYYDVHAPYTPPVPYDRMYVTGDPFAPGTPVLDVVRDPRLNMEADNTEMHKWLEGVTDPKYPVAQYAAGVSYVDEHVGRVVADLKAKGLYDDALIILVADHGEHLGEHQVYYGHALPYQEVLHVPLIVKWPQGVTYRQEITERVTLMDVLPTVLEIVGIPIPDGLDGRSLVDLALGRSDSGKSLLVAEQGETPAQYCKTLTEGDWKLMLFFVDEKYIPVLFDLATDPLELTNIAQDYPDIVESMAARLWEIFDPENPFGENRAPAPKPVDEKELKRLKSLGYVR